MTDTAEITHTARLEDGRIGHDKNLFPDWAVAEGPFMNEPPWIPTYIDQDWITQAHAALKCPQTDAMLEEPMDSIMSLTTRMV